VRFLVRRFNHQLNGIPTEELNGIDIDAVTLILSAQAPHLQALQASPQGAFPHATEWWMVSKVCSPLSKSKVQSASI
jgi:hypothetical protein